MEKQENWGNYPKKVEKILVFAKVIDIQASLLYYLGKHSLAFKNWQQVGVIYQQVNLPTDEIRSYLNQSMALRGMGRYVQANKILRNTLPQINQQPDSELKAIALRNWGNLTLAFGELEAAFSTLQSSYRVAQKIQSNSQIIETLLSLGYAEYLRAKRVNSSQRNTSYLATKIALDYGNYPISGKAEKIYQIAADLYEQVITLNPKPINKIKAQLSLLKIKIELGELEKAQDLYSQLQENIHQIPLSEASIKVRLNLAKSLLFLKKISRQQIGEWQEITALINAAMEQAVILDDLRSQSYCLGMLGYISLQNQDLTSAQKFTENAVNLSLAAQSQELAYLWQWQLGFIFRQQGNVNKAIDFYTRSVQTLNDLRADLLILNPDIQYSFRDKVEPVYRQLVDLLLESAIPTNQNQAKITQARDTIEELQLREIENYFQEACFQAKPEIIDTIVEKQGGKAAVIYPILLKNRIEIILKLPNQQQFKHYTYPIAATSVEKIIEELQQNLREPDKINRINELSAQVYSWLIQPLESQLQASHVETLVFVLDGYFRNIPMSVLYDRKAPKNLQYLIQKYAIVLAPGLQMLDPKPLKQQNNNAIIAGISESRLIDYRRFNGIQNVETEIQMIQKQIPNNKKLFNQTFTDVNLEQQIDSGKYTIAHIATHANFSSESEETYLLAWNKLLNVKEFDRLFQITKNLENKAIQLLVLSACETAAGDRRAALGLSGIAIRAGTRSTLATLWAVEDKSTAEFMGQFYSELKKHQFNKAKALQIVQNQMIKNGILPKNWAPYILIGNWI